MKERKQYLTECELLMKEWDKFKNWGLKPEEITKGSHKKIWWVCNTCGHSWSAVIYNRTNKTNPRGCPVCAGKVVTKSNSLKVKFPRLYRELHKTKNIGALPKNIPTKSNRKVWWKCRVCNHSWCACVSSRTDEKRPSGCPACAGRVVTKDNNLKVRFTEVAKSWHPTKNGGLLPEKILSATRDYVWWKCLKCDYSWEAYVCNRTHKTNPTGCPVCAGKIATPTKNLSVDFSELCEELDIIKNKDFNPKNVLSGCNKVVWWECKKCGLSWRARIASRTDQKSGCPVCSRGPTSSISQKWLDSLNVEIREYSIKSLGLRVDGFDPKTNTAYEFLGDYWHGNPKNYSANKINPHNNKTFGQLYQETMERIEMLKENGYKVIYIWESDFKLRND